MNAVYVDGEKFILAPGQKWIPRGVHVSTGHGFNVGDYVTVHPWLQSVMGYPQFCQIRALRWMKYYRKEQMFLQAQMYGRSSWTHIDHVISLMS